MGFYPYENFYIETDLSPNDIESRLSLAVERKRLYSFGSKFRTYDKPYNGAVEHLQFKIIRNVSYRNIFLPQIEGVIIPGAKTCVHVIMRLKPPTVTFMISWIAAGILFGLGLTIKSIIDNDYQIYTVPSYAIAVFGYLLSTLSFKYESSQSKDYLFKFLAGNSQVRKIPKLDEKSSSGR